MSPYWCEDEVYRFVLRRQMLEFRLQQHPLGPVEDQKARGGCWVGGGSREDAKGHAGAPKATRKKSWSKRESSDH